MARTRSSVAGVSDPIGLFTMPLQRMVAAEAARTHRTTGARTPVRVVRLRLGATTEGPVRGRRGERSEGEPQQSRSGPSGRTGRKAKYRTSREWCSGSRRRRQKSVEARLKPARARPVGARLKPTRDVGRATGLWKTSPVRVQIATSPRSSRRSAAGTGTFRSPVTGSTSQQFPSGLSTGRRRVRVDELSSSMHRHTGRGLVRPPYSSCGANSTSVRSRSSIQ